MSKTLYIIRGISGSGKTTRAKELASSKDCSYFEADQYFTQNGHYQFSPDKLSAAHKWCFENTCSYLQQNNFAIVSNTFTQIWEMKKYIDFALKKGIDVVIFEAQGNYSNVHGVSEEMVQKQRDRFEPLSLISRWIQQTYPNFKIDSSTQLISIKHD